MVDQARDAKLKARQAVEEEQRKQLLEKQESRTKELAAKEKERQLRDQFREAKKEQDRHEREIQRICDASEELKDLERKIKMAYIKKERAAQHQEALLLRKLESDRELAMEELMEHNRQLDICRQEERENERRKKLAAQKEVLQKQMIEHEVSAHKYILRLHCLVFFPTSYPSYPTETKRTAQRGGFTRQADGQ